MIKSLIVNLAISAIWMVFEYVQFGELQFNRGCDNIVFAIYFGVIWFLFYKIDKDKNLYTKELIKLCKNNKEKEND